MHLEDGEVERAVAGRQQGGLYRRDFVGEEDDLDAGGMVDDVEGGENTHAIVAGLDDHAGADLVGGLFVGDGVVAVRKNADDVLVQCGQRRGLRLRARGGKVTSSKARQAQTACFMRGYPISGCGGSRRPLLRCTRLLTSSLY